MNKLYNYKAIVTDVYDGDSITINIDLGFGIELKKQKIRLHNLNAPEIRGENREAGIVSRDALREKILNREIFIETIKDKKGKYGRWIGIIWLPFTRITESEGESSLENINEWLINNNYADYRVY